MVVEIVSSLYINFLSICLCICLKASFFVLISSLHVTLTELEVEDNEIIYTYVSQFSHYKDQLSNL